MWKPMDQAEYEACEPGENGDARLEILLTGSNVLADANSQVTLTAKVTQNNTDITNNLAASMFNWTRDSGDPVSDTSWANDSDHRGKKSITVEPSDLNGTTKFYCKMRPVEDHGEFFPAVEDGKLMLQHDTHTTGDGHVFEIGHLIVNGVEDTTSPEIYLNATVDNGTPYSLDYPDLLVDSTAIAGPMTAGMYVYTAAPTREIRFFYNADGLRTRKQTLLGGRIVETTDYILHGKLVTEMRRGSDILHFFYDAQSRPAMVDYNGKKYTYVHNLQGDIVAMVDSSGAKVVEYRYDAWGRDIGRTLTSDIGELNPFRYRGYVYDEETGLYYLRSRYYSAGIGRFISLDIGLGNIGIILAHDSWAYCKNCTLIYSDDAGKHEEYVLFTVNLYCVPADSMPKDINSFIHDLPGHCDFTIGNTTYSYYGDENEEPNSSAFDEKGIPAYVYIRDERAVNAYASDRLWFSISTYVPKSLADTARGVLLGMRGEYDAVNKRYRVISPQDKSMPDFSRYRVGSTNCIQFVRFVASLVKIDLPKFLKTSVLIPRYIIGSSSLGMTPRNEKSKSYWNNRW